MGRGDLGERHHVPRGRGLSHDNANGRNLFVGCYSEGDQNPSQFASPTLVIGGLHGAGTANYAGHLETSLGQLKAKGNFTVGGILSVSNPVTILGPSTGAAADSYAYIDNTNYYSNVTFRSWLGGAQSNDGTLKSWRGNGLVLTSKSVTHLGIDFVTGTFEVRSTGAVLTMPGGGLGYGSGAGGSVTQATSKSTGSRWIGRAERSSPTARRWPRGGGELYPDQRRIAASDTFIANLASGATAAAYRIAVDAVAAGSCRISISNLSGGSLAETLSINFAVIKAAAA